MKKLYLVVPLLIFILSCTIMFTDLKIQEGINSGLIRVGASQNEIISAIGKPMSPCIRTKMSSDGNYELWDYASEGCAGVNLAHRYVLIFKDMTLVEIRTVKTELDMRF